MSYIAERRQEEKDRRRIEIVEAAEDLYREMGWDAVTMDSVARRARLSRALVYVYFKDKRDLHFAIAIRAMETLHARFRDAAARAKTGLEKIEAMGRAYMAYGQEFPHYFDACARLELHVPDCDEQATPEGTATEASENVHEVVVEALRPASATARSGRDLGDLQVTSRVLWGFTHGIIQIAITKASRSPSGVSASRS